MTYALGPNEPIPVRTLDVRNLPIVGQDPPVASYDTLLAPRAVHLRLTTLCDAECNFCERVSWQQGDKEKEGDFTPEAWQQVKEKFLPYVEGVEAAGLGEPTLSKLFPVVAKDTLAAGKIFYFPTNGHFLDTKLTDCLGDGTGVRASVSVDAGDAATYLKIGRGKKPEDYEKVWASIAAFGLKCPQAFLHSQFTASIDNIDGFPEFMRRAAEAGIKEVQFRFVQTHTIAREDVSLRFAKDRTEAALTAGWQVAHDAGVTLNAERRPYSEENPNAEPDKQTDATSRLKRYLDFAPMDVPNCPPPCTTVSSPFTGGATASGTFVPTDSYGMIPVTYTGMSLRIVCGTCITNSISATASRTDTNPMGYNIEVDGYIDEKIVVCGLCTTNNGTTFGHINGNPGAQAPNLTGYDGTFSFGQSSPPEPHCSPTCSAVFDGYSNIVVGGYVGDGNGHVQGSPGQTVGVVSTHIDRCCATAGGNVYCCDTTAMGYSYSTGAVNTSGANSTVTNYSGSNCPPAPMSEGTLQVVRTVKVPRQARGISTASGDTAGFQAQSIGEPETVTKVVNYASAALIVWDNGDLTTCFARHSVGNLSTDTWESVITNPRYQAFLQNRENGNVANEAWCWGCARNY